MYFTQLPDHTRPDFDENLHFSRFKKQNIVFNALSTGAGCDNHIGCLSFKTVLKGEEWYGIDGRHIAVRPGQFLILNDDQPYSCHIGNREPARIISIFFKKEFANAVLNDAVDTPSLDNPTARQIEFFQTLYDIDPDLRQQLNTFITHLDTHGYNSDAVDEYLIFFLHHLIRTHRSELTRAAKINALKPGTRTEIYKRLCIAKDAVESSYHEPLNLETLSKASCLSVPQLVRHFHAAFHTTPHRYLAGTRLRHAAQKLATTNLSVKDITWQCGFEDASAFCRAFRSAYGAQPEAYRKKSTRCQPSIS
jgi:AraC-like DNA-binding protein